VSALVTERHDTVDAALPGFATALRVTGSAASGHRRPGPATARAAALIRGGVVRRRLVAGTGQLSLSTGETSARSADRCAYREANTTTTATAVAEPAIATTGTVSNGLGSRTPPPPRRADGRLAGLREESRSASVPGPSERAGTRTTITVRTGAEPTGTPCDRIVSRSRRRRRHV
jgi:hypothetical protein